MKYKLLFLFFLAISFHINAQFSEPYRNSKIVLKTGDTLMGKGKTKNKGFKYKAHSNAKPYFIEFSKINFVEQKISKNKFQTFKFFQSNKSNKFFRVEEFITGKTLELYAVVSNTNVGVAGGGSFSTTMISYYLKKRNEEKLNKIGVYDPVFSDYISKVKNYFSDCPKLIKQIEDKKLRFRNGLEKIVEFYNNNCELK